MLENEQPATGETPNADSTNAQDSIEASTEDKILAKLGIPESPDAEEAEAASKQSAEATEEPVEYEGKTYTLPKEIKGAVLRHADYTRKTQELAAMRDALHAQQQQVQEQLTVQSELNEDFAQLKALDRQYKAYQQLNWAEMGVEDMMRNRANMDMLRDAMADAGQALEAKKQALGERHSQSSAKALEQGNRVLAAAIPGWGEELRTKLAQHARKVGFSPQEISGFNDPRIVQVLHRAYLWDTLQESKPGVEKRVKQAAPFVKPGASNQTKSTKDVLRKALHTTVDPRAKAKIAHRLLMEKL